MIEWSVKGAGDAVTVVSPVGDVYPFVITCLRDLRLKLHHRPDWHGGREPDDAALKIYAAHGVAARWAMDTLGPIHLHL
ncbi:hypothetical protein [Lichenibacterium dinghuense]|uniref:hypothetical protein n=1 Tax=Lichenibacterium dinghuense TaxID=2895977 RepID=UPI001F488F31|nr:hypothetical protein [Lichenibacterium sp. 6Y81]